MTPLDRLRDALTALGSDRDPQELLAAGVLPYLEHLVDRGSWAALDVDGRQAAVDVYTAARTDRRTVTAALAAAEARWDEAGAFRLRAVLRRLPPPPPGVDEAGGPGA